MRKKFINNKGFTLIELTVSIAVITIMSAVALVGFNDYNKRSKVDTAAYKLASDIRTAQNNSLSLKEVGGVVPAGGWGLSFTRNDIEYIFFADDVTGGGSKDYFFDPADDYSYSIALPNGVTISQLNGSGGIGQSNGNQNKSAIVFEPPEPTGYITGQVAHRDTAKILTITLTNGSYSRNVIVNVFGLVDVQ